MASDLPSGFKKLSSIDRKLFVKTYDMYKGKNFSDNKAFDNALFAVGRTSDDLVSSSINQDINLQTVVVKEGGFFNSNYFFDATLSSTAVDDQNEQASPALLRWLDENQKIDTKGDIKHIEFNGRGKGWKGLFNLVDHRMEGEALKVRFSADKSHPKFKEFLKMNKETPFNMLSAEFINPKYIGNKIVYASKLGWTLTDKGSNPDSKIEM